MNRWFDLLRPDTDVEVMHVGDVLHILAGNLQPNKVLRGMDFPDSFSSKDIRFFADSTRSIAHSRSPSDLETFSVLVSDRASSDDFFATPAAEWPESGAQKRSVPNLSRIVESWSRSDVKLLDGARMDIYEQIVMHSSARTLVGQHGAGLTNMIWMPPGSHVIEILPPMPKDAIEIFKNLAQILGIHYTVIHQSSLHAGIDEGELTRVLASITP